MPTKRLWTNSEYFRMAEVGILGIGEKVELIEGEILNMSPVSSWHVMAVGEVADILRETFTENCIIRVQQPIVIGDFSEPEPDVAVVVGKHRDYKKHPTTALLVVEISSSTLAYDRKQKSSLYAKAGIPDYWIVNLVDSRLEVRRRPVEQADSPFGYGYASLELFFPTDEVSPLELPERKIEVATLFP